MVFRTWRNGRIRRGLVVVSAYLAILLVAAFPASGESATLEFSPDRVVRGQRSTIQIRTSIPWGEEVTIQRPELVGPMVWWAYPYARPWVEETPEGTGRRMVEVLGTIRVDAPGFFLIGPFRISAGDRTAVTEPREIIGLEPDEADYRFPVSTMWRTAPEQAWQGQALSVVLEARNLSSLALADTVTLTGAPSGLLETAPGLGSIVTRAYGNEILYDVPMGSWIWTPSDQGLQRFPAARVRVAELDRAAPSFTTRVRPLPEAVQDSGAVGHFRLSLNWDERPVASGEIVSVRVRVEGEGNLNVLRLPVPELEGAQQVGRGTSSAYIPGSAGFEGWREERYDFQFEKAGSHSLILPGWAWLEPEGDGRIRRQAAVETVIKVDVSKAGGSVADDASMFLGSDMFRYPRLRFQWRENYWFLLALPGFIAVLVLFLVRRPNLPTTLAVLAFPLFLSASNHMQTDEKLAGDAVAAIESQDYETAGEIYRALKDSYGEMPGLLHDMALLEMEKGNIDETVLLLRRALLFRPGSRRLTATLTMIENRLGLDNQVPPSLSWSPGIVFAIWLFSVNAFFLVLFRFIRHRSAKEAILFISVVFVFVASSLSMAITESRWRRSTAIVSAESQPLRKIPGPLASDWIKLPEGTAVSVTATENGDSLVRTGYGLEGWLPKTSLFFINGDDNGL